MPETTAPVAPAEAVDPFKGGETSFEEYSQYRKDGTVPERFKESKDEPETPPAAQAETVEGQEPPKDAEQEKEDKERDEKGKFRKKVEFSPEQQEAFDRAFRKREAKLRREFEERYVPKSEVQATPAVKAETADANEPPKRPELPKLSEYKGTIEEFDKETAEYPAKYAAYLEAERQSQERAHSVQQRLNESEARANKAHADYKDEFKSLVADIANDEEPKLPPHIIATIAEEADDPHELTYQLAKNREEYRRFAALEPHQALREVLKFEARIAHAPAPEKKPATPKPAPPAPVGARATSSAFDVNDENTDIAEWTRQRNAQEAKRRGR
jgi:hypothetical protein